MTGLYARSRGLLRDACLPRRRERHPDYGALIAAPAPFAVSTLSVLSALRPPRLGQDTFFGMLGETPAMRELFRQLEVLAPLEAPVLLEGEAGVGKALAARALHLAGPRAEAPFVSVNAAEVSPALFDSEVFGLEEGAFTGALAGRPGLAVQAETGTLLIEEVGSLSPASQMALQLFLETRQVVPVGGSATHTADVRVVCTLVPGPSSPWLRPDLRSRLSTFTLRLPALAERPADLAPLAYHFAGQAMVRHGKQLAGIDEEALALLAGYPWPGNVQELEEEMQRAVILTAAGGWIGPEELSAKVQQ